jgi:pyrimidine deaminase RibD-like protein
VVREGAVLATAFRGEFPGNHAEYTALETKLHDAVLAGADVYTRAVPQ